MNVWEEGLLGWSYIELGDSFGVPGATSAWRLSPSARYEVIS